MSARIVVAFDQDCNMREKDIQLNPIDLFPNGVGGALALIENVEDLQVCPQNLKLLIDRHGFDAVYWPGDSQDHAHAWNSLAASGAGAVDLVNISNLPKPYDGSYLPKLNVLRCVYQSVGGKGVVGFLPLLVLDGTAFNGIEKSYFFLPLDWSGEIIAEIDEFEMSDLNY